MEKKFELGLVLGRFQPMHNGHQQIVEITRSLCQKTLILISSAQESGTFRNPFQLETRKNIIDTIYGNKEDVIIGTMNDMTNENDICFEWGKYILNHIENNYGRLPDLMVYGKDESRKGWFSNEDSQKFSELIIARNKINISATKLREYLVQDKKEEWKSFVPKEISNMYETLRNELLKLEVYHRDSKLD